VLPDRGQAALVTGLPIRSHGGPLSLPKIISGCIGRVVWASQDGNSGDPAGPFGPSVANKGPRHGLSLSAASLRQANQTLCKRVYFVGTSLDD
jgi:hypothetical protein